MEHGWNFIFLFSGVSLGHEKLVVFASCSLSLCTCLSALFFNYCSFQVIIVQRSEKHERRRGSSR